MVIFFIVLILWYLIGLGIAIYVTLIDEDLVLKDIPILLLCGLMGPIMIGLLFQEDILKMPKLFDSKTVLLKKFKKDK